jgi:hypothetical protein
MCHDVWCDAVLFLDLISHTITAFNLQLKVCVTFFDMTLWSLAHPYPRCTHPALLRPARVLFREDQVLVRAHCWMGPFSQSVTAHGPQPSSLTGWDVETQPYIFRAHADWIGHSHRCLL